MNKDKVNNKGNSIRQLILDAQGEFYKYVIMARDWAKVLTQKDEFKNLSQTQILDQALKDILTNKVSLAEIDEALSKLKKKKIEDEKQTKK